MTPFALAILAAVLVGCVSQVPEEIYAEARKDFDAADYKRAEQKFAEFVRKHPDHTYTPPAYYFLGTCRARLGDSTGAIEAFLEAERIAPEPNLRASARTHMADIYRRRGEWEKALEKLRELVDSTAGAIQKNFAIELARTIRDSGNIEDASAYLWERAAETEDARFRGEYFLSLADIYWATETVDPMLSALSALIDDASIPQDLRVRGYYWRGQALAQVDRFDEAVRNYQDLRAAFPGTIEAVEAEVALAALYQEKDPELSDEHLREATEEFAKRIADATESADDRNVLRARTAEAYFRLKRYKSAIAAYEEILELNPDNEEVRGFVTRRIQEIRDEYARDSTLEVIPPKQGT